MGLSEGEAGTWGRKPITMGEAASFAARVQASPREREAVAQTLFEFPLECEVRGMFFVGLVNAVASVAGHAETQRITELAEVPSSVLPFTLHPHRDFYKLFFLASPILHPRVELSEAMRRVAETFYPTFRASPIGRTMSLLMGNQPRRVLERLADAYNISVAWNSHACEARSETELIWRCRVEPTDFYEHIFTGIVHGTLESHEAPSPRVELMERRRDGDGQRMVFSIRW
ncbi:MAG: TIGR02265 family protein [Myxococcota bacterium]|nr:TIGR02265 family protein [Myxococcota bacterium]